MSETHISTSVIISLITSRPVPRTSRLIKLVTHTNKRRPGKNKQRICVRLISNFPMRKLWRLDNRPTKMLYLTQLKMFTSGMVVLSYWLILKRQVLPWAMMKGQGQTCSQRLNNNSLILELISNKRLKKMVPWRLMLKELISSLASRKHLLQSLPRLMLIVPQPLWAIARTNLSLLTWKKIREPLILQWALIAQDLLQSTRMAQIWSHKEAPWNCIP